VNNEKKSLGRGLDSLLGEGAVKKQSTVTEIPVEELAPGQYQPRKRMHKDTLEELSDSIKQQGVLQPIVVRKQASGLYEIVVGERRWRAAQLAGLETIPSIIKDINNSQAARMSLIENLQREDLNAMDQARGLQRLQMEFNLSQEDLGRAVGKSRSSITNLLRLTKLSQEVQKMLEQGMIEMGHARALLSLKEENQAALARDIVKRKLSVREVEGLVSKENITTKK
jgi:ParB family chromosome partitioning protein